MPSTGIPAIAFVLMPFGGQLDGDRRRAGLLGLASGFSLGSLPTSTDDVIPAHARGRLQAVRGTTSEVGGISGPLIG